MEVFFILFVVFAFSYLLGKDPPPKPKSAGDKLMDGLSAVAKELGIGGGGGASSGGGSSSKKAADVPWQVLVISVAIGLLLTYL